MNSSSKACFFSNRGGYIDVAAPGDKVQTTGANGEYQPLTGSSAAAAHVSGLAALVLSRSRDLAGTTTKAVICASAVDLGSPGWDPETGMGMINCETALSDVSSQAVNVGIVSLEVLPRMPMPGQEAHVLVSVRNHGISPTKEFSIVLKRGERLVSESVVRPLQPKETQEAELAWPTTTLAATNETISAEIPALPGEVDLRDNARDLTVPISSDPVHDIAILSCRATGAPIVPGAKVSVEVQLANTGNQDEAGISLTGVFSGRPIAPGRQLNLRLGERVVLTYEWACPGTVPGPEETLPVHSLIFMAQPVGRESNTNDNRYIYRLGYQRQGDALVPLHAMELNKEVHQWIAWQAYLYFLARCDPGSADSWIGNHIGSIPNSHLDNRDNLIEGSAAEDLDNKPPLNQGGFLNWPFMRHFCAGGEGQELLTGLSYLFTQFDSAYTQAARIWQAAVAAYSSGNKGVAFYYLGHIAHLIGDMNVPAHVHNDDHGPLGGTDYYEDNMAYTDPSSGQSNWKLWLYGGGRSGNWSEELGVDGLETLFRKTASYSDDYDSSDYAGDATSYNPGDYAMAWHRPQDARRPINSSYQYKINIIGDDLMPYAMRRAAELVRSFYNQVDTTGPSVSLTYPTSEDFNNPTVRNALSAFDLTASASDPESGVLKQGYQYKWAYWTGSNWSSWSEVSPSPTGTSVSFTPAQGETWYCFYVAGENGGGHQTDTWSNRKYLRIILPTRIIRLEGGLDFGDVTANTTASRTLTIYNDGNSTLSVSGISYPSGFDGNWNSGTISAGGSREVTVTFAPTAAQSYGGTITVNSDKTSGTDTRSCSGTGVAAPTRSIRLEGDLAFGNVVTNTTAQRTLTIYNDGNSTMTVSSISYPSGFSGVWSGSIATGGAQNVTVTFSPIAAITYNGNLAVNSDATSGTSTWPASGTGMVCTYTLTASGTNHGSGAESGSFEVTSPGECNWSASSTNGWIHITGGSGSGNGMVSYTVEANAGSARAGTITVGGQAFTIYQAGPLDQFSYTINNGRVTVTGYIGTGGDATIPSTAYGLPVTSIGSNAFYNCTSLTRVTIPNSVTNIGDRAFFSCTNLTGVYFQGNAPNVGSEVFSGDNQVTVYYLPGTTGWEQWVPPPPAGLWKPQVQTSDASFGVQTNQFGFNITWASDRAVVVEACTDLANPTWSPLQTNTLTGGLSYFSDPQWTNYPVRFYRLRWP